MTAPDLAAAVLDVLTDPTNPDNRLRRPAQRTCAECGRAYTSRLAILADPTYPYCSAGCQAASLEQLARIRAQAAAYAARIAPAVLPCQSCRCPAYDAPAPVRITVTHQPGKAPNVYTLADATTGATLDVAACWQAARTAAAAEALAAEGTPDPLRNPAQIVDRLGGYPRP